LSSFTSCPQKNTFKERSKLPNGFSVAFCSRRRSYDITINFVAKDRKGLLGEGAHIYGLRRFVSEMRRLGTIVAEAAGDLIGGGLRFDVVMALVLCESWILAVTNFECGGKFVVPAT